MEDSKFRNSILFLVSLCVIVLFLLLIINGNKKVANVDGNIQSSKNNYIVYEVDQSVKLIDDSEWYVLRDSSNDEKEVYLISKNKVNNEKVEDTNRFISDIYLDILCSSLQINREQVSEIRLLNSYDICNLYKSDCSNFNTSFDSSKYKLLESDTLVDYSQDNKKYSLCREGFCDIENNDIRVIIKIAKYFIKKED